MKHPNGISRRDALKQFALLCGIAGALAPAFEAQAADAPHLSPDDPLAQGLGYSEDAKAVDKKKFPSYVAGQICSSCQNLQGSAGQPYRPCTIFQGKVVNANGWCAAYQKKG
jgi:hypothetical protein